MRYKIVVNLFFVIFLAILQIAFVGNLPFFWGQFNLLIVALIFILSLFDLNTALLWALGFGFLLDIYSFNFFGVYLISLFLSVVLTNIVLVSFLTNRSLYSFFGLVVFATFFFELIIHAAAYLFSFFELQYLSVMFTESFWHSLLITEILNLFLTLIIFYLVSFFSHRLRPSFLIKQGWR